MIKDSLDKLLRKLIILMIPFFSLGLLGQVENHRSISLHWGMGNIMRQDINASPFIHKEWSPINAMLSYQRSKRMVHLFDLKYSLYNPSIVDPYPFNSFYNGEETGLAHRFELIDFNYAIGSPVLEKERWGLVLGGKSRNHLYTSDYNFGPSGPSPYFFSFGLDLWLTASYELSERHYVSSNISLPIFSYISRAPYLTQDDRFFENIYSHKGFREFRDMVNDGALRSWGKSQRFEFDLRYGYVLNEKWDLAMNYLLSMNFNQSPRRFTQFENVIHLGGKIKF